MAKGSGDLSVSLACARTEGLLAYTSTLEAHSLRGALLQVVAAAAKAECLIAEEIKDPEPLATEIQRLMFSVGWMLQRVPEAAVPEEVISYYLGAYRNPFRTLEERQKDLAVPGNGARR